MSSILKKALIGGLAALTFGLAVAETTTPALAFRGGWGGWHGGGFHGGWGGGWRGGWGGRGYGWGGVGAGLALGAAAAGLAAYGPFPGYYGYAYPYYGYGYGGCWQTRPVYDYFGNFRGYRPVAVC